jgi:GlcNAc-P-P-Und epimerase
MPVSRASKHADDGPRVLVTGGSGFIGTNLVELYVAQGTPVLNLDAVAPRNPAHAGHWRAADVRDAEQLSAAVSEFDPTHAVHLAARTDLRGNSVEDYSANVAGVENVIHALTRAPSLRRAVFASSRLVCRIGYEPSSEDDYSPTTAYGASKVEGERIVRSSRLEVPWTIVRPTSIWGPWFGTPYRDFFLAVARGRYVHPRGRRIYKSFGFVGNTVHQLDRLLTAETANAGRTLYLGDYPPIEVFEWASLIRRQLSSGSPRQVPLPLLRAIALMGDGLEKMGANAPLTRFRLANMLTDMVYDLEPIRRVAADLPVPLEEAVEVTVAWLRTQRLVTPS